MKPESMKNIIVLKDLPSNIVDEAFVILKSNKKIMDLIIPKKLENKISQRILDVLTTINNLDTVSVDISGDANEGYFTASINVSSEATTDEDLDMLLLQTILLGEKTFKSAKITRQGLEIELFLY
mgnify:CR=1 FL=1